MGTCFGTAEHATPLPSWRHPLGVAGRCYGNWRGYRVGVLAPVSLSSVTPNQTLASRFRLRPRAPSNLLLLLPRTGPRRPALRHGVPDEPRRVLVASEPRRFSSATWAYCVSRCDINALLVLLLYSNRQGPVLAAMHPRGNIEPTSGSDPRLRSETSASLLHALQLAHPRPQLDPTGSRSRSDYWYSAA